MCTWLIHKNSNSFPNFTTQLLLSDKWKSFRLGARFQIFFQLLGGYLLDPPLLNPLPDTDRHTHYLFIYMQHVNVKKYPPAPFAPPPPPPLLRFPILSCSLEADLEALLPPP